MMNSVNTAGARNQKGCPAAITAIGSDVRPEVVLVISFSSPCVRDGLHALPLVRQDSNFTSFEIGVVGAHGSRRYAELVTHGQHPAVRRRHKARPHRATPWAAPRCPHLDHSPWSGRHRNIHIRFLRGATGRLGRHDHPRARHPSRRRSMPRRWEKSPGPAETISRSPCPTGGVVISPTTADFRPRWNRRMASP